ncbi:hypothetical protein K440DRAFT_644154 [Wilcoxina mikolae CBS 423.85]|nr:hypothetical protein K440DRAFT_644154 [Wilcoxina mikolae CBS 423.85]
MDESPATRSELLSTSSEAPSTPPATPTMPLLKRLATESADIVPLKRVKLSSTAVVEHLSQRRKILAPKSQIRKALDAKKRVRKALATKSINTLMHNYSEGMDIETEPQFTEEEQLLEEKDIKKQPQSSKEEQYIRKTLSKFRKALASMDVIKGLKQMKARKGKSPTKAPKHVPLTLQKVKALAKRHVSRISKFSFKNAQNENVNTLQEEKNEEETKLNYEDDEYKDGAQEPMKTIEDYVALIERVIALADETSSGSGSPSSYYDYRRIPEDVEDAYQYPEVYKSKIPGRNWCFGKALSNARLERLRCERGEVVQAKTPEAPVARIRSVPEKGQLFPATPGAAFREGLFKQARIDLEVDRHLWQWARIQPWEWLDYGPRHYRHLRRGLHRQSALCLGVGIDDFDYILDSEEETEPEEDVWNPNTPQEYGDL